MRDFPSISPILRNQGYLIAFPSVVTAFFLRLFISRHRLRPQPHCSPPTRLCTSSSASRWRCQLCRLRCDGPLRVRDVKSSKRTASSWLTSCLTLLTFVSVHLVCKEKHPLVTEALDVPCRHTPAPKCYPLLRAKLGCNFPLCLCDYPKARC